MAALHGRERTGAGTYIDVSMYEGLLAMMGSAASWVAAGAPDPSWGGGLLSGGMPFYDCYQTADDRWLAVAAIEPTFFRNLCVAIDHPELIDLHGQAESYPQMRKVFEEAFLSRTLEDWLVHFEDVDAAVAPVRSSPEAFREAQATGQVHGTCSVGPVPRMSAWAPAAGAVVATPGTHTRELLSEAGFSEADIDTLMHDGVVGTSSP